MKSKKFQRKLSLGKKTIFNLNTKKMEGIVGGATGPGKPCYTYDNYTCLGLNSCVPTCPEYTLPAFCFA